VVRCPHLPGRIRPRRRQVRARGAARRSSVSGSTRGRAFERSRRRLPATSIGCLGPTFPTRPWRSCAMRRRGARQATGALLSTIAPSLRISGGVEDREDLDDFFFRFVDHDERKTTHPSLPLAQENNGRGFPVGLNEPENLLQSHLESIAKATLGSLIPRESGSDLPCCCGRKAQLHTVASRSTSLQNSSSDKAS